MSKEEDLKRIKRMHNGCNRVVNWFEEGGADVYKINNYYLVFYVPQYGGEPVFEGAFHVSEAEKVIELAYSWT